MNTQVVEQIEVALSELRPTIQMDGGDIQFVSFVNGVVSVKLLGACVGCPMSFFTLKMGVEEHLKGRVEGIIEVVTVD